MPRSPQPRPNDSPDPRRNPCSLGNPASADERFGFSLPLHYEAGYPYPLVVWVSSAFNGGSSLTSVVSRLSLRNYVAVAPFVADLEKGLENSPLGSRELSRRISRCIQRSCDRANIHRQRIFLVVEGDLLGPSLSALPQIHSSICGVANVGHEAPLPPTFDWTTSHVALPSLLFCLAESDHHQDLQQTWRLYHSLGFPVRIKTSSAGSNFLTSALRNVDRWIMEQVTGVPSLDPVAPPQPHFCLN